MVINFQPLIDALAWLVNAIGWSAIVVVGGGVALVVVFFVLLILAGLLEMLKVGGRR